MPVRSRAKALITGIVQGVGFRPFLYNLASSLDLAGYVVNTARGVDLEVEGSEEAIKDFFKAISTAPPPLSYIKDVTWCFVSPTNATGFEIGESLPGEERAALISPDVCVCEECLAEMEDPSDRRYGYPFINCTNCGPRYTIIEDIPYDRCSTTMKTFHMCPQCLAEYHDPTNRRFHAQPNACPSCGPKVSLLDRKGIDMKKGDPLREAVELLAMGKILAVKGLGGFHLAADARNDEAVMELRRRKNREEKPFAVMVRDLNTARRISIIDDDEARVLLSRERPIVLLRKRVSNGLSTHVSPVNSHFGLMLPYTPLHHLLMKGPCDALVMTSGNRSDEPITFTNEGALRELSDIADFFLIHDREIHTRSDDSVVRVFKGKPQHIRRSRGYVPVPVFLSPPEGHLPSSLGLGAELKCTICLVKEDRAFLSQHIGDMENLETFDCFKTTLEHLQRILEISPSVAVHDLHPDYLSTRYALSLEGLQVVPMQHHHAHVVSCMAENAFYGPAIGVALDGTGYGPDGTVWGGEVFVADPLSFRRVCHLDTVPLPGGDAAAKAPWRMALSYLHRAYGKACLDLEIPFIQELERGRAEQIITISERGINSPLTSSCGRLFDAVSALIGIRQTIAYEGQAAIELEMHRGKGPAEPYPFEIRRLGDTMVVDTSSIIRAIVEDIRHGVSAPEISARFHRTLVDIILRVCERIRDTSGLNDVFLSGGCFQNLALLEGATDALSGAGFEVRFHSKVPTNDAGVSLGQAVHGSLRLLGRRGAFPNPP
jgi:hydrogenase maturation protein HypF